MRSTVRLEKGLGIEGSSLPRAPVKARMPQKTIAPSDDPSRAGPGPHDHHPLVPVPLQHPPIFPPQDGDGNADMTLAAASSAWRTQAAMPRPR